MKGLWGSPKEGFQVLGYAVRSCFYFSYHTGFHVQGGLGIAPLFSFKKPINKINNEILAPLSLTARLPNPQSTFTKQCSHWGVTACGVEGKQQNLMRTTLGILGPKINLVRIQILQPLYKIEEVKGEGKTVVMLRTRRATWGRPQVSQIVRGCGGGWHASRYKN